jgi:Uma2 family endonuclease
VDAVAKKHLFTVEEYHRMGETGIFGEDDRVELIDEEVVEMPPIGWRHAWAVTRLTTILVGWSAERCVASVQNPITLSLHDGEPLPDLVLVKDLPVGRLPGPEDALLVIEVADTSLEYDRERKLPLYARAGMPEVWIVDLRNDAVEVYSEPAADKAGYARAERLSPDGRVTSATLSAGL